MVTSTLTYVGAGPIAMSISGAITDGGMELYNQYKQGAPINWEQVAVRAVGGAVSGAISGKINTTYKSAAPCGGNLIDPTTAQKQIKALEGLSVASNFAESTAYQMAGGASFGEAISNAGADMVVDAVTDIAISRVTNMVRSFCFVEGTPVLTALGLVAIETISAGDIVIATDTETGETAEKEVLHTFINETDELVHLTVNGEEIVSTPGHKFYAPEKGWTSAIDLCEGDILVLVNGEYVVVEQVQQEILESPVKVYNFEVEDFHTYYVGEQSVLVHNRKCEKRLPKSNGHWDGEVGNSNWYSDLDEVNDITGGAGVPFVNGRPVFEEWSNAELTFADGKLNGTRKDFALVYEKIRDDSKGKIKSKYAAKKYLKSQGLTPHHYSSTVIQLVPTDLHSNIPHIGSASDLRGGD